MTPLFPLTALVISVVAFYVAFKGSDWIMSHVISEEEIKFYWESWETLNVTPPPYAKMAIERRMKWMKETNQIE